MGLRYRRAGSEIITGFSPDSLLLAAGMSWGTRWIVNVLYKGIWSYWGEITIRSSLLIGVLSLTSRKRSARREGLTAEGGGRGWQGIGGWEVFTAVAGRGDCNRQWKKGGELVGAGRGTEEGKKWEASIPGQERWAIGTEEGWLEFVTTLPILYNSKMEVLLMTWTTDNVNWETLKEYV